MPVGAFNAFRVSLLSSTRWVRFPRPRQLLFSAQPMKRNSLFLAAFLVLGGMFRLPGPSSPSSALASSGVIAAAGKSPAPGSATEAPAPARPGDAFERSLIEAISAFYGNRPSSPAPSHFASTGAGQFGSETRETPRFLIALVPDPLHTHLSLLFDRTVRSIQMGIQADGTYSFDRAVLPWKHTSRKDNETPVEHDAEELERKQRESYPGLLMFRGPSPLFVFVVGEKPTSGINNLQFQNAMQIIRALRPASPR